MADHGAIINFSKVNSYIYLGTNSCCKLHFKKSLLRKGVRADVSMESERIDKPWGVDYFLWLPTPDMTAPTLKKLKIGAEFIDSLVSKKVKVYIHCKNGHGRAPTMTAAYFIYKGVGIEEALKFIKKKRTEIHLNKKQKESLKKFKKIIDKQK